MSDSENELSDRDEDDDEEEEKQNDNINFVGSPHRVNGWKFCLYCNTNFPPQMFLNELDYCGHCWAWLNSQQVDLMNGTYEGLHTIEEIMQFLKLTYSKHPTTCVLEECVYNKIRILNGINGLNDIYAFGLGLKIHELVQLNENVVEEKTDIEEKKNTGEIEEIELKKKIKIKRNLNINYDLSSVWI